MHRWTGGGAQASAKGPVWSTTRRDPCPERWTPCCRSTTLALSTPAPLDTLLSQPESPISQPSSNRRGNKRWLFAPQGAWAPTACPRVAEGTPAPGVGDAHLDGERRQLLAGCWGWWRQDRPQSAPSPPAGHSCSIGWWQSRIPAASGLAQKAGADTGLSRMGGTGLDLGAHPPGSEGQRTPPCTRQSPCRAMPWGKAGLPLEQVPPPECGPTGRIRPLGIESHGWK